MREPLAYSTCRQIRPSGRLCGSPALKDQSVCYQHSRQRQRRRNMKKAREVKDLANPKRPGDDYRPLDDLNAAIWEALDVPALEDSTAVSTAATCVMDAVGSHHLDPVRAKIITNLIRIAEINLRQGHAFATSIGIPAGLTDPQPIPPFGDAEGFVLPEEGAAQRSHQQLKQDLGAHRANELRTELGYNDHMIEPLAASSPEKKPSASAEKKSVPSSSESTM